jgi:hypothetical protein
MGVRQRIDQQRLAQKESRFNSGFAAFVSFSLPAGEQARPAGPMVAGLAAFQLANFVGVFSSRDARTATCPIWRRFKRCRLRAGVVPPTGLFTETAASVRASRRVASGTLTLRVNKIPIPLPAQLIQMSILNDILHAASDSESGETIHSLQIPARQRIRIRKRAIFQLAECNVSPERDASGNIRFYFMVPIRLNDRYVGSLLKA